MTLSAMELQLWYSGFCWPHTHKQTQTKYVHDLHAPWSVSRIFIFMCRSQWMQVTYRHLTNHSYSDHWKTGADWVLKPAMAKILKRPFLPFLSSFFFVSNRPWAAHNQAAYDVAIAKTPQRPVRLCWKTLTTPQLEPHGRKKWCWFLNL